MSYVNEVSTNSNSIGIFYTDFSYQQHFIEWDSNGNVKLGPIKMDRNYDLYSFSYNNEYVNFVYGFFSN